MLKRRVTVATLVVLALVVGAVVLTSCSPKEPVEVEPMGEGVAGTTTDAGESAGPQWSGDTIKIGAIFSVDGPAAPLGVPEKMAVEMIAEQINDAGGIDGRQVEVIVKDDKSGTTEAVTAAKDLIETEKVCAIIGPSRTPTTMAIKDLCQEAGVPLVSCAAGNTITNPVASNVFAVPQTDVLAVAKIIDYLKEEGITKVASIYVANPYGESGNEQINTQCADAGIEVVVQEKFGGEDTDMTPQLTKIKAAEPGAVICWGTNPGPAKVAMDAKKLGIDVPVLQSHGVANKGFIDGAEGAAEGAMLPAGRLCVWQSVAEDHPQKQVLKDFAEAFAAKYQRDADTFAGHAYDALHIVVEAIERANSDDRAAVRAEIEKTQGFVGTAGVFNYTAEDHNGLKKDAFVWVKIENDTWKLAE